MLPTQRRPRKPGLGSTHRLLSSSFLGLPYRILNMKQKQELLRSLWVYIGFRGLGSRDSGLRLEGLGLLRV